MKFHTNGADSLIVYLNKERLKEIGGFGSTRRLANIAAKIFALLDSEIVFFSYDFV
jgi:hypothetical protein